MSRLTLSRCSAAPKFSLREMSVLRSTSRSMRKTLRQSRSLRLSSRRQHMAWQKMVRNFLWLTQPAWGCLDYNLSTMHAGLQSLMSSKRTWSQRHWLRLHATSRTKKQISSLVWLKSHSTSLSLTSETRSQLSQLVSSRSCLLARSSIKWSSMWAIRI